MTEAESLLWEALRNNIQGYKFRRQHPIADYIADFVCLSNKLIIEVDGGYHDTEEQKADDRLRTDILNKLGFRVIRFKNEEVTTNPKEVISLIKEELNKYSI